MQHPFQRPFCALLLSLALVAYFMSSKTGPPYDSDVFLSDNETSLFDQYVKYLETNFSYRINVFQDRQYFEKKTENGSQSIHILGLFELTTKYRNRSEGHSEVASAKLAIERINSLDVLPGYHLELIVNDTMGDPGIAIDRFFYAIYSKKTIIMLLGSGYSNVTERLAHVVPYWNVLQVSFGSKSPTLSDRQKFPLFFRTVAPDSSHNTAKIRFVKYFSWKKVATFSQSGNAYLLPVNRLVKELESVNVSCTSTVTFSQDNYREQLQVVKNQDVRIIIGSFSSVMATKIFCAANDIGMHGDEYVWILQGQEEKWWLDHNICPESELKEAIRGIFMFHDYKRVSTGKNTFPTTVNGTLDSYLSTFPFERTSNYVRETYDAVWSMALAMRESVTWATPLEQFHYSRKDMTCRFISEMESLKFVGVSGPVSFNGADRVGNSIIRQFQDGIFTDVAVFDSVENVLNLNCPSCKTVAWKNEQIPIAHRTLKIQLITIPPTIFYVVVIVSTMGVIASVLFFYFNLHFRRMKTVKLSSPKLNNIAVVGCICVYISVILFALNNAPVKMNYFKELCTMRVYLLSAGFSLAFGSILAKSYRVHRLFAYNVPSLVKDKLLMDKQLIFIISIPLLVDGMICGLWVFIDPMERHLRNLPLKISPTNRGIVYQPQVEVCRSENTVGWYVALFGYKGIILIIGLYMAWKTRHIKVLALNDSQYIGICVYSAVFCAIIVALSALISGQFIVSYLARTISILAATTIALMLLFLSKIRCVFGKVDAGDSIMESMGLKVEYNTRRFILNDRRELIHRLEVRNKVYKAELENLEREIVKLEEQLLQTSTSSTKSSVNLIETTADCHFLNVPVTSGRGSWPSAQHESKISQKGFHSENKLDNDSFFEKFNLFGKLKKIFGSFSSLQAQSCVQEDWFKLPKGEKGKVGSNPEFYSQLLAPVALSKVKSEMHIGNSN